jgi:DNA polymerase III epsilon subunit-like protein
MRKLVADTETAGLDPKDGVVEIALIEVDDALKTLNTHYSLIDPEGPISPSASGVHGIVASDVADAPTLAQFFDQDTVKVYCDEPLIVIGHNIDFDLRFIGSHLRGKVLPVCTLRLARAMYPDAENHKLQTLRYVINLEAGDAHSALGDTVLCLNLIRQMTVDLNCQLEDLVEACQGPLRVHRMPFGKHHGLPLDELPRGYRKWLMEADIDRDLRYSLESL